MLKNLILDWSGTVVDDLDAVVRATNHVLSRFGTEPISRDIFRERFCLPWINFYKQWLPHIPREGLDQAFWEVMLPEQERIPILPHAMEFLEFARANHLPIFICSTVDSKSFWGQSNRLGVSPFLRKAYVGIEDKRKVIHQILVENQLDASETIFVGDMVHDVETAKHGGVHACAVLTGYDREEKLAEGKPDFILRDLRELRLVLESQNRWMDGHPVATVGALILNKKGECLMVRTKKWSNKWGIPGGKVKRGETSEDAVRREIREETNLELKDIHFAMVQDCIESKEFHRSAHFLLLNYVAHVASGDVKLNDEAQEWKWIAPGKTSELDLNIPTRKLVEHFLKEATESLAQRRKGAKQEEQ